MSGPLNRSVLPILNNHPWEKVWSGLKRLARRRILVILCFGLLSLTLDVTTAWFRGIPIPAIHDELSRFLAADTFAKGRLTNPTPPFWEHFESFHILIRPTYMSAYPPAYGFFLALGKVLFGQPVFGLWVSNSLMAMGFCWMLYGWFPGHWAVIGSLISVIRLLFLTYWSQSYMGGSVAAFGGSLVFGALPRMVNLPRVSLTLTMGLGLAVLATSRPLEGLMACQPASALLVIWVLKNRPIQFKNKIFRFFLPMLLVIVIILGAIGLYNKAVTGNIFKMPQVANAETYSAVPLFLWQPLKTEPVFNHLVIKQFEEDFTKKHYFTKRSSWEGYLGVVCEAVKRYWRFYLGVIIGIPLVLYSPWMMKNSWMAFAFITVFLTAAFDILALSIENRPDYLAPVSSLIMVLLIQSLRLVYCSRFKGRRVGRILFLLLILHTMIVVPTSRVLSTRPEYPLSEHWQTKRTAILERLKKEGGKHLILVRYGPRHDYLWDWVYNEADIDRASIVWAREMEKGRNLQLLKYFKDRQPWLLEIDDMHVKPNLQPYPTSN